MCVSLSIKKPLIALALSLGCIGAFANDCQTQINQSVVDYGNLNPAVLRNYSKSTLTASLEQRVLQLNIVCATPRALSLSFQAMASGPETFKLGNKGEFDLILSNAQLDGVSVLLGEISYLGDLPGRESSSAKLKPNHYIVPLVGQRLMVGKSLSVRVEVNARLFVEGLNIRDVAAFDGQGYFYLAN